MATSFPTDATAVCFQMPNEVDALHAAQVTPRVGTVRE